MDIIKLIDLDSTIPNLALMKLSHWYKSKGNIVIFSKFQERQLDEPNYDMVYASSIFTYTDKQALSICYPGAIIGGTGSSDTVTVEDIIGQDYEHYDYSIYPDYKWSIGYTQRGCRFNCKFCVVPKKEGQNKSTNSIHDIWRSNMDRKIRLIDNDFFGQELWKDRCQEIIDGKFQTCLDQGINLRVITDEQIDYLAQMDTRNHAFKSKCIYTAWDNLKHEKAFLNGLDRVQAKIKKGIVVLMLIGFVQETDEEIGYRVQKLIDRKVVVYPMIYNNKLNLDYQRLTLFRNWMLTKACYSISFDKFISQGGDTKKQNKRQMSFGEFNAVQ